MGRRAFIPMVLLCLGTLPIAGLASQCYGTTAKGALKDAVQLAEKGADFSSYSTFAGDMGRTYVHRTVAQIVENAYARVFSVAPQWVFVYGETGKAQGGPFWPHRTHQNGLSVDFFVPVRDHHGQSVQLPTTVANKLGYDIEFDAKGQFQQYTIDFEALSEHLYQLSRAATAQGVNIKLLIIDTLYLPKLLATKHGKFIQANIPLLKGKPWVRHDEHYHVDFDLPCKKL